MCRSKGGAKALGNNTAACHGADARDEETREHQCIRRVCEQKGAAGEERNDKLVLN